MSQKRRKFSPQFKAEAVQFVIETGRPVSEIAKELENHEGTLGNWVKRWKYENPEPETALTPMRKCCNDRLNPDNFRAGGSPATCAVMVLS